MLWCYLVNPRNQPTTDILFCTYNFACPVGFHHVWSHIPLCLTLLYIIALSCTFPDKECACAAEGPAKFVRARTIGPMGPLQAAAFLGLSPRPDPCRLWHLLEQLNSYTTRCSKTYCTLIDEHIKNIWSAEITVSCKPCSRVQNWRRCILSIMCFRSQNLAQSRALAY